MNSLSNTRRRCASSILALLLPLGLGVNTALAAFNRLDNFNSGTAGTQLSTYNSKWAANADFKIAVDPLNSANMVGSIARTLTPNNWGTAIDFGAANYITVGNTGTVFFRMMVGTNANTNFGMYVENGIGTDTSKRQVSTIYNTATSFVERGGSSNTQVTTAGFTFLAKNVWYDFWYVASNTSSGPTFKVYAAKEGATPIAQTLLSNEIGPVQTFQSSTVGVVLQGLMFLESSGNSGTTEFYFDDIYVDPTGQDLTNPLAVADPYNDWALTNITAINPTADATATGDPDGDGVANLTEFAFHGDPLNGTNNGYQVSALEDTDSDALKELTLSLAVRNGSGSPVFTGSPSPSATVDGITYTIEGSLDLAFPNSAVSETALPTGLPALPTGWEYRRFRLDASNDLPGNGFLRAKVVQP